MSVLTALLSMYAYPDNHSKNGEARCAQPRPQVLNAKRARHLTLLCHSGVTAWPPLLSHQCPAGVGSLGVLDTAGALCTRSRIGMEFRVLRPSRKSVTQGLWTCGFQALPLVLRVVHLLWGVSGVWWGLDQAHPSPGLSPPCWPQEWTWQGGGGGDAGSISSVSWQHSSLFPSSLREEEREIFIPLVMMLPCTTIELARSYHCYQISGLMGFTQVAGRRKVCWGSTLALKCQLMTEGEECKEFYIRDFLPFCHVLDWGDHFVFKKEKRGKNPHMYTIHVLQCCRKILKEPCFYCNWFLSLGLKWIPYALGVAVAVRNSPLPICFSSSSSFSRYTW